MEERKFINVEIEDFDNIIEKSHYLEEFIQELQSIWEANKDKYDYMFIKPESDPHYDEDGVYLHEDLEDYQIVGCRYETDEEYQKRIEPIEERKKRWALEEQKKQAEELEKERQLYHKLRAKFEGEEKCLKTKFVRQLIFLVTYFVMVDH